MTTAAADGLATQGARAVAVLLVNSYPGILRFSHQTDDQICVYIFNKIDNRRNEIIDTSYNPWNEIYPTCELKMRETYPISIVWDCDELNKGILLGAKWYYILQG